MTLDERVEQFMRILGYGDGSVEDAVRDVIRQAENDALERAAMQITEGASWCTQASADVAFQCARAIRSLKHPE